MIDINSPVALITGASRGLGLVLARELANQKWWLILDARGVHDLEKVRAELSALTRVTAIPGDVSDPSHREALAHAASGYNGINVLINNASLLGPSPLPLLLDYPLGALEQVYRANVFAPLALVQIHRPYINPGGVIINISSDAGMVPYAGWGGYGSSKAALEHISAILSAENPQWRIYWVDPGDMRTQMQQDAFPGEDISDRPLPETSIPGFLKLLSGTLPGGRYKARELI